MAESSSGNILSNEKLSNQSENFLIKMHSLFEGIFIHTFVALTPFSFLLSFSFYYAVLVSNFIDLVTPFLCSGSLLLLQFLFLPLQSGFHVRKSSSRNAEVPTLATKLWTPIRKQLYNLYSAVTMLLCRPIRTDPTHLIRLSYVTRQSSFYQFPFTMSNNDHCLLLRQNNSLAATLLYSNSNKD